MTSYYVKAVLLAAVLWVATWLVARNARVDFVGLMDYGTLAFFFVFSIVSVVMTQRAVSQQNNRQFINALTGSMVAKVLLTAFLVLILGFVEKPKSVLVVVPMFVYYVAFTVLEVSEFLRLNRKAAAR